VENGAVILSGATTENPYFEVNAALVSRSQVHLLRPLGEEQVRWLLKRALQDERGYKGSVNVSDDALGKIAHIANGDARIALNALELAVTTAGGHVSLADAEKLFAERSKRYDRTGEEHYDTVSAFIKTMRGSDVDAALVWLFKMIASGEEPRFVFRRMAIFASEDIGNADPRALQIVMDAWRAFEFVGLPEGEYFLAHACIYLSQAPKSNAVKNAMFGAKEFIETATSLEVPYHLRNAPMKGMAEQGYGKGYVYPHDTPEGVAAGLYFPIGTEPMDFYSPSKRGFEAEIHERIAKARSIIREGR